MMQLFRVRRIEIFLGNLLRVSFGCIRNIS